MRLAHLSDLHLGKRVNDFSLLEDQEYILEEILRIIREEGADAVLIAGDVYDKPVPPAEAVRLFDRFLTRLAQAGKKVFVLSGNHDSAERIAFGSGLMQAEGVYLSPVFRGDIAPVSLADRYGTVHFYLLPFIKPAHVRHAYPEAEIETYQAAVRFAVERMRPDQSQRNVILAHQFVTGAVRCDSEDVSVGGLDSIEAGVFDPFDYAALGHIHNPQTVGSRETVRYCGTPLKYSFSEAGHQKSLTLVDMLEKGNIRIQTVPLVPKRDLREIRGSYAELTALRSYRGTNTQDYLHVVLTDETEIVDAIGKLRAIYPNIMQMSYDNCRTRSNRNVEGAEQAEQKSPLELLKEFYFLQNNQEMTEQQAEFSLALIEQIWEGEKI